MSLIEGMSFLIFSFSNFSSQKRQRILPESIDSEFLSNFYLKTILNLQACSIRPYLPLRLAISMTDSCLPNV